ncbi:MAG: hypothetical protein HRU26_04025 [Psychroserpens sp.]|nr:hypothetical protein [Psychroserpens sp.]
MNTVTSSNFYKKDASCNPVDTEGNPIRDPETFTEYEKFSAWIESVFDNQSNFARQSGYSRKQINLFCNGKRNIPGSLKMVWKLSLKCEELKQEISKMKRSKNLPKDTIK